MDKKKKPYKYASNEYEPNKLELWIEHLKAPHIVKNILITLYCIFLLPPLEIYNGIKSFIFWTYVILAPFIIIWWIFTMVGHILGHH